MLTYRHLAGNCQEGHATDLDDKPICSDLELTIIHVPMSVPFEKMHFLV